MLYKSSRKVLFEQLERAKRIARITKQHDKQNITVLEIELGRLAKRHARLSRTRILVFFLLYASLMTSVSANLPLLSEVAQSVAAITGIVGVGLLTLLIAYLTWRITSTWNQMMVMYSHLIVIYEKNSTKALEKE